MSVRTVVACLMPLLMAAAMSAARAADQDGEPKPAPSFTVVTCNHNYGNMDMRQTLRLVEQSAGDVICFQESTRELETALRKQFAKSHPHMKFLRHGAAGGLAVISKHPIVTSSYIKARHGWFDTWVGTIKVAGRPVQVVNVHLKPTTPPRERTIAAFYKQFQADDAVRVKEIKHILSKVDRKTPVVVLGDFNAMSNNGAPGYMRQEKFIDSFASVTEDADNHASWHWMIGKFELHLRIDYIFHNDLLSTRESRMIESAASDHNLVVSVLEFAQ